MLVRKEYCFMKYYVNENCIGCGLCTEISPNVFSITDVGLAEAIKTDIAEEEVDKSELALASCPVEAIERIEK